MFEGPGAEPDCLIPLLTKAARALLQRGCNDSVSVLRVCR